MKQPAVSSQQSAIWRQLRSSISKRAVRTAASAASYCLALRDKPSSRCSWGPSPMNRPPQLRSSISKRAVRTAASAASFPLLLGPGMLRSLAWRMSRTVSTPSPTGTPV